MEPEAIPTFISRGSTGLPDSRRVAIQRMNRATESARSSLLRYSTGASHRILTETDKYWINISDDLYFFNDGKRFLWSSERTGFRHYYLYDLSGKELTQLTSGDWAITGTSGFGPGAAAIPPWTKHTAIFISSRTKTAFRKRSSIAYHSADKKITRITKQPGTHDVTIAPDNSAFVDRYSNVTTPPRQDLYRRERRVRRRHQRKQSS